VPAIRHFVPHYQVIMTMPPPDGRIGCNTFSAPPPVARRRFSQLSAPGF